MRQALALSVARCGDCNFGKRFSDQAFAVHSSPAHPGLCRPRSQELLPWLGRTISGRRAPGQGQALPKRFRQEAGQTNRKANVVNRRRSAIDPRRHLTAQLRPDRTCAPETKLWRPWRGISTCGTERLRLRGHDRPVQYAPSRHASAIASPAVATPGPPAGQPPMADRRSYRRAQGVNEGDGLQTCRCRESALSSTIKKVKGSSPHSIPLHRPELAPELEPEPGRRLIPGWIINAGWVRC